MSLAGNSNFWILLPGRKTLYPGLIIVTPKIIISIQILFFYKVLSKARGGLLIKNFVQEDTFQLIAP